MIRSRLLTIGIAILVLCVAAAAGGCTQQDDPSPEASPALRATNIPEAIPTLEPTDRSAPPPTTQPTDTPTSNPAGRPTHTPEAVPTPESTNTAEPDPASQATDTPEPEPVPQTTIAPLDCVGLFPTSTPDPNRPEVIPGRFSEFWTVSSYEEAECITGYPIYVPSNLPDGFIRNDNIFAVATGTEYFEDRYVELGWHLPGDPAYGFMLSQHSWPFGIDGEPAMINGILGERYLRPAIPPDLPPLLVFFWEEDGYWFTISGFLGGPITEELLLEVAASLQPRDAATGIDTTTVSQECSALDPTSTPDPNRPEGILGRDYQFWNVSSFEEAECITDYPIAIPTNLPDGFIRGENIIVHKRSTSHFEDRWVEHGWGIPGDPSYGFRVSQHSWKFGLGDGKPTVINGIPGERSLRPAIPPDFPPLLTLLWEEDGYWYTVMGFLDGPITEEFLMEVAASLEFRDGHA